MAKSHFHSYFFHWFLIYHFRISFAIISNVYSYSTLLSLFLILFTTIQHSMIWMFQGLFNQLLLTHWSHPFHAITNNTKHNCTYIKFISECALHEASEVVQDIRLPQGPTFTSLRSQLLFLL